jgi:ectoine hydroxylase-related dioxygenase (phytanoyl-CoA dioxygenase family)
MLTEKQINSYWKEGYLVLPNVYSRDEVDRLRELTFKLYNFFVPDDVDLINIEKPWNAEVFDKKMLELRKMEPHKFGALYDCAQCSTELINIVTDSRSQRLAADLLNEPVSTLAYSGVMMRIDVPQDKRNSLGWHQDRSYYPQNFDGNHGLVMSIALQDIDEDGGALRICPESHKEGFVEPEMNMKEEYHVTEQRSVPEKLVNKYKDIPVIMNKGDVFFINMNLFHRSGLNKSNRIRFSTLIRYHRMLSKDFVPFGLLYQFNDYMNERSKLKEK